MEKINTPLGDLLEELKDQQSKIPENAKEALYWRGRNEQIDSTIKLVESLLPTEREVIEKAFNSGATASNLATQGKDYFTKKLR